MDGDSNWENMVGAWKQRSHDMGQSRDSACATHGWAEKLKAELASMSLLKLTGG